MISEKKPKITIIGSGLAGSFLAVLLAQRGYRIEIYERLSREDICDEASKRSYNIVLFGYGIHLLQKATLWDDIKPYLLTLQGTITHIPNVQPIISLVDGKKMPYFSISRACLADILLKKAALNATVTIHYNTQLLSIDRHHKSITVKNRKTKDITTVSCEVIIGADGANSLVRAFMQQGQHASNVQEYAPWVYKQFILSPEMVKKLDMKEYFVYDWKQKSSFVIMHPDSNGSMGAMVVYPKNDDFVHFRSPTHIKNFFEKNFQLLAPAAEELSKAIFENPEGNFSTIHTDPWYYKDFMVLVGDAAHGFYPFFGQGTSAAFGDCMELINLLETYGDDWSKIFPLYQDARKKHMDALGELSKEALLKYLRYKRADYHAIYDKLELMVYRVFPNSIYPPFSQTITTDPEHAADHRQRYLKQKNIAKHLGFSLFVSFLTKILYLYERTKKSIQNK